MLLSTLTNVPFQNRFTVVVGFFFFNETILRKKNNKPCNLLKIFGHGIFIVIFDDLILLCDFPKQNHVISDMNSSDRWIPIYNYILEQIAFTLKLMVLIILKKNVDTYITFLIY